MADEPAKFDPFKPAMPRIPGVPEPPAEPERVGEKTPFRLDARRGVLLATALVLGGVIAWWVFRAPGPASVATVTPGNTQREPYASPAASLAPETVVLAIGGPAEVAAVQELAKPWSSKRFQFRKRISEEAVPAIVVRLPGRPASSSASYWAFSLRAPFGRWDLEYVTDLEKLDSEYGYRARHPMVGDPCTWSVYDPLRLGTVAGGVWARGEVVQCSGIRPPVAIEIRVQGGHILATQIE